MQINEHFLRACYLDKHVATENMSHRNLHELAVEANRKCKRI